MDDLEKSIKEIEDLNSNDEIFIKNCVEIAEDVSDGNIKIHDVVTNLQHLLVHSLPEKRATGTFILSTILMNVHSSFLTNEEVQFISSFYADRLKDHHQVFPAVLKGILAISYMVNNSEKSIQTLLASLFDNICCQQQQISDRYTMYEILKTFSRNFKTAVLQMGQQFLLGIITSMDGERDPRCLLFLFTWLPDMLKVFPVGESLVEELFDVMSCYFPVDFRAPPSLTGQQEITRDELAMHLNKCLCAIQSFDQFCLPLILEKLNSALKIAKLDSLNLLANSCKIFQPEIYNTFSQDIWSNLQKEILNNSDEEIKEACLNATTVIIGNMATSENNEVFITTCQNMYDTLHGNLRPDAKLFKNSSDLLLAIARGSTQTCKEVAQLVLPLLLNQYNMQTNVNHQYIILTTLASYVEIYIDMLNVDDITQIEILYEVAVLYLQAIQHTDESIRTTAFHHIPNIFNICPSTLRESFYPIFKRIIIEPTPKNLREEILKCLEVLSEQFSTEILEHIISESSTHYENIHDLLHYFEALRVLAPNIAFTDSVLNQVITESQNKNKIRANAGYFTIRKILEDTKDNNKIYFKLYNKFKILETIITYITSNLFLNIDMELSINQGAICRLIVRKLDSQEQSKIVDRYVPFLVNVLNKKATLKDDVVNKIILLEGFLTVLRSDVIPNKYKILESLLSFAAILEPPEFNYGCYIIANILNKSAEDESFTNFLQKTNSLIEKILNTKLNVDADYAHTNAINLHAWITKALVMKGSSSADDALKKLLHILDDFEYAAYTFSLIMDDTFSFLGTEAHCQRRFLYRQQFVNYVTEKFCETIQNIKPNYLIAIGAMLSKIPQQIIIVYSEQILCLIIICLRDCPQSETLIVVLSTLEVLLQENANQLESYIDNLIESFLILSKFPHSMKVRMSALRCLRALVKSYPVYQLLPYKQKVVFELGVCVDDKKRLVRQEAVTARSAWFLLDAPA